MTEIPGSDAQGAEPEGFTPEQLDRMLAIALIRELRSEREAREGDLRREFIGRPDRVKDIFLATATDLRRDRHFQGRGLLDVMRAIQPV
jgi:hypothetical protein